MRKTKPQHTYFNIITFIKQSTWWWALWTQKSSLIYLYVLQNLIIILHKCLLDKLNTLTSTNKQSVSKVIAKRKPCQGMIIVELWGPHHSPGRHEAPSAFLCELLLSESTRSHKGTMTPVGRYRNHSAVWRVYLIFSIFHSEMFLPANSMS